MPLTPEDVQNKRFSTVRFKEGYDEEEVDAFLDEVEAELRRLLGENDDLRSRAPGAPAPAAGLVAPPTPAPTPPPPPAATPEPSEAALRTLLLAQRTADEAIAQARQEADQLVAAARTRASQLEQEAQAQRAQKLGDLERDRQSLERQIEELRAFEREYRTRLRAYLEGQLRDLDHRAPMAPGRPPAAGPTPGPGGAQPDAPQQAGPQQGGPAPAAGGPPRPGDSPAAPPTGSAGGGVPGVAPPAGSPSVRPPASPFSAAPPLVEEVDAGSDAPTGPPREAGGDVDDATPGGTGGA